MTRLLLWLGVLVGAFFTVGKTLYHHDPVLALIVGALCGLAGGIGITYYLPIGKNPGAKEGFPTREGVLVLLGVVLFSIVTSL
jgi:hypothetical protein